MVVRRRRQSRRKTIDSEEALANFCKHAARKSGLNRDRLSELYAILREALYASASGRLSTQKAVSLTLRFLGTAIDTVELHI